MTENTILCYDEPVKNYTEEKQMGVASLVLGIISLVAAFIPGLNWLGAIFALIGVVLGALGRKNPEKKGIATGGLVCSIIGLVLGLILWIACASCVGGLSSLM